MLGTRALLVVVVAFIGAVPLASACSDDDAAPGASSPSDGGASSTSSSSSSTSSSSGSTSSSSSSSSSGDGAIPPGICDSDPLKTGIVAQQTGISADAFDCAVLKATAKHNEPDAMIFKAIMYNESRFDKDSVACPNLPCGMPNGWTNEESRCYGVMQIVPACKGIATPVLLPNGHPNLTKDASSPDYATSVFNPEANIDVGVAGIADNRAQVVKQFPGCTVDQYTLMAIGNYASYGSTKSCTIYNTEYTKLVLKTYGEYATAAKYTPHPYP